MTRPVAHHRYIIYQGIVNTRTMKKKLKIVRSFETLATAEWYFNLIKDDLRDVALRVDEELLTIITDADDEKRILAHYRIGR